MVARAAFEYEKNDISQYLINSGYSDYNCMLVDALETYEGKDYNIRIALLALQKGANNLKSALLSAAISNAIEIVEYIMQHTNYIQIDTTDIKEALKQAAKHQNLDVIKVLSNYVTDDNVYKDMIYYAIKTYNLTMIKLAMDLGVNSYVMQSTVDLFRIRATSTYIESNLSREYLERSNYLTRFVSLYGCLLKHKDMLDSQKISCWIKDAILVMNWEYLITDNFLKDIASKYNLPFNDKTTLEDLCEHYKTN